MVLLISTQLSQWTLLVAPIPQTLLTGNWIVSGDVQAVCYFRTVHFTLPKIRMRGALLLCESAI